jgi:hypothetical protein
LSLSSPPEAIDFDPVHALPVLQRSEDLNWATFMRFVRRMLAAVGDTLTVIGALRLLMGAIGVIDPERFAMRAPY